MTKPPLTIYLAAPRGFCAGVDRAIKIVEMALEKWGAPVYGRHEIVHNTALLENDEYSPIRPLVDWLHYNGFTMVTKPAVVTITNHSGVPDRTGHMRAIRKIPAFTMVAECR